MEVSKSRFVIMLIATLVVVGIIIAGISLSNCSINKSNITIYLNDQKLVDASINNGAELDYDNLKYDGYKVLGVYDNPEFQGEPLTGKITIDRDITIYIKAERLFTIMLQSSTSSTINIYAAMGDTISMPTENLPTKENAKLLGYKLYGSSDSNILLSQDKDYTLKDDDFSDYTARFVAVWENAKAITLKIDDTQTTQYLYAGEQLTLPHTVSGGRYVSSWTTSSGGIYNSDQTITVLDDMTLTAIWSPCKYTLKFVSEDGAILETIETTYGSTVTLPTGVNSGLTFEGWQFTLSNGTTVLQPAGSFQVPDLGDNGEKVFTAVFTNN